MKRTITITTQKEIELLTPVYRKWGNSYYRVDENYCVKVEAGPLPEINLFASTLESPWDDRAEDATELEFYTAYAAARAALNEAANIIDHQLNETGHD